MVQIILDLLAHVLHKFFKILSIIKLSHFSILLSFLEVIFYLFLALLKHRQEVLGDGVEVLENLGLILVFSGFGFTYF